VAQDRSNYDRTLASEGLMEAANTTDPLAREAAYERAKLYQRLAEELDAPVRPPPQEPAQPAAQQQHQIQPKTERDEEAEP
jgi:hypothetical protein